MADLPLLLYPKDAAKLLGVGTSRFYELVKLPSFPKPRRLTGKRPMFLVNELKEWVKNLELSEI